MGSHNFQEYPRIMLKQKFAKLNDINPYLIRFNPTRETVYWSSIEKKQEIIPILRLFGQIKKVFFRIFHARLQSTKSLRTCQKKNSPNSEATFSQHKIFIFLSCQSLHRIKKKLSAPWLTLDLVRRSLTRIFKEKKREMINC